MEVPTMFDKYMIVGEEFKNVEKNDEVTGFQLGERLPYYRGITLSLVGTTDLVVDGERYSPDQISVTLHGNTYKLTELEDQTRDRWEFGEVGILTVDKPGGLEPGEHQVQLTQQLKISYVPFGFKGSDAKKLTIAG
jgi:hypothetical protein